jgi:transcription initiation factor TFIIIB Brf1 subunit/transcription initiation factor TFIIB
MEFNETIWSSLKDFSLVDISDETIEDEDVGDEAWSCPMCKTDEHVEEVSDEMICRKCGTVLETLILQGPEFRWFGSEDRNPDPSRCSCPINPLLPESSLGTTVLVKQNHSREMIKIKRYHLWNQTHHRERTLWNIFDSLHIRGINAGITPAVVEEAKRLYHEVSRAVVVRGTQREALLASCIYEALKTCDAPRRPRDVAKIFKIETSQITKGIKQFQHLFEKAQRNASVTGTATTNSSAVIRQQLLKSCTFRDFVEPFLQNLHLNREKHNLVTSLVHDICERIDEWGLVPENTPPSLTATAITMATKHLGISKSMKEIASGCDISSVTIQKCLKRLQPWQESILTGTL